jgi:hypothetical protein
VTFTGGKPTTVTMLEPPTQSLSVSIVFSRVIGGTTTTLAESVLVNVAPLGSIAVAVATLVMSVLITTPCARILTVPVAGIVSGGGASVPS